MPRFVHLVYLVDESNSNKPLLSQVPSSSKNFLDKKKKKIVSYFKEKDFESTVAN